MEFMHLTELEEMHMLSNQLTGPLPATWSHLQKLRQLYLARNALTGTLPADWSTMTSLQFMWGPLCTCSSVLRDSGLIMTNCALQAAAFQSLDGHSAT